MSTLEAVLIVPLQASAVRLKCQGCRCPHPPAMQTIVVASVLVFFTDALTYLKPERRSDSDIPRVEKAMYVSTEKKTVG